MADTETPAALLRRAAKLMRFNAVHVPPSPWFATAREVHDYQGEPIIANCGTSVRAIYVAAAGPGFLLTVADWLEAEAGRAAEIDGYEDSNAYPLMLAGFRHPLAVARAYLGETDGI